MTAPQQVTDAPATGDQPTPPAEGATPSPADMPQNKPPAQAAAEPGTPEAPTGDDGGGNPDAASVEVTKLRKENASRRTQLREQEARNAALEKSLEELRAKSTESEDRWNKLASILNPEADTPPTAEQLTEQFAGERAQWDQKSAEYDSKLSAADQKIRELTIRAALPTAAAKAKAHPDGLMKVLVADGVLAKLDPASDTFAADLESAASEAVEQNPYLKVAPVVTRSGAPIPGGSGGSDQLTYEQVKKMSPDQVEEARKAGKLRSLLGG